MKKLFILFIVFNLLQEGISQTNTFPVSGNVGIGTTNPQVLLQIAKTATTNTVNEQIRLVNGYNSNGNNAPAIIFTNDGSSADPLTTTGQTWAISTFVAGGDGGFHIYKKTGTNTLSTPFFIENIYGKIGIGTTNPGDLLTVNGIVRSNVANGNGGYYAYDATIGGNNLFSLTRQINHLAISSWDGIGFCTGVTSPSTSYKMFINSSGNVGIGTINPSSFKLAVEGNIGARKVIVTKTSPFPDYVFNGNYRLPSLIQIEQFIKANKHLPELPSAKEVEKNGLDIGDNQTKLLKKIEELTLYLIEQNKEIKELKNTVSQQQKEIEQLKAKK